MVHAGLMRWKRLRGRWFRTSKEISQGIIITLAILESNYTCSLNLLITRDVIHGSSYCVVTVELVIVQGLMNYQNSFCKTAQFVPPRKRGWSRMMMRRGSNLLVNRERMGGGAGESA